MLLLVEPRASTAVCYQLNPPSSLCAGVDSFVTTPRRSYGLTVDNLSIDALCLSLYGSTVDNLSIVKLCLSLYDLTVDNLSIVMILAAWSFSPIGAVP